MKKTINSILLIFVLLFYILFFTRERVISESKCVECKFYRIIIHYDPQSVPGVNIVVSKMEPMVSVKDSEKSAKEGIAIANEVTEIPFKEEIAIANEVTEKIAKKEIAIANEITEKSTKKERAIAYKVTEKSNKKEIAIANEITEIPFTEEQEYLSHEYLRRFRGQKRVLNSTIEFTEYTSRKVVLFIVNYHFVMFNSVSFLDNIYFTEFAKHYKYDFDVLHIGPQFNSSLFVLSNGLSGKGAYSYHSLTVGYQYVHPKYGFQYHGFVVMNDDSCVDPIFFNSYDHSRSMGERVNRWNKDQDWMWNFMKNENGVRFSNAFINATRELSNSTHSKNCHFHNDLFYRGWSDFFYVSNHNISAFLYIEETMFRHRVFLENAVPNILACFNPIIIDDCNHGAMNNIMTCLHVHPVKFSKQGNRDLCMERLTRVNIRTRPQSKYR